jgi:hypothetical protein
VKISMLRSLLEMCRFPHINGSAKHLMCGIARMKAELNNSIW